MNRVSVFISSPYTVGDPAINVKFQMDTTDELLNLGFLPFTPLYSHFQHMVHPREYEDWMEIDFQWVERCDCLLRLGGKSPGGDREVLLARQLQKPVFFTIKELTNYYDIKW